jgi:hypothetical protein
MPLEKLPPTVQHVIDLQRELDLLGSALVAEQVYLDQLAELVESLVDPLVPWPGELRSRIRSGIRRLSELVEQRAGILDEFATLATRGISTNVPVRVYCRPDLATNPEGSTHDRSPEHARP